MPSRLLSQKINVSNSISKLSPLEEVVFLHLLVTCDDYGRFYGHPDIVKGMLFSRREFTSKQIERAMMKLEDEGMIHRYERDGTVYLELTSWLKYQRPRAKESKYPGPNDEGAETHELESVYSCEQMQEEQEESENQETKPTEPSPILFTLPLNMGEYGVTEEQVKKYKVLYPDVDVEQELRNMIGWLDSYPNKRKTASGIKGFITRWLSKEQNGGRVQTGRYDVRERARSRNTLLNYDEKGRSYASLEEIKLDPSELDPDPEPRRGRRKKKDTFFNYACANVHHVNLDDIAATLDTEF